MSLSDDKQADIIDAFKDICGYFQCALFLRLQKGKVVWVLSFDPKRIRINTASDILMSYRCSDIFFTK